MIVYTVAVAYYPVMFPIRNEKGYGRDMIVKKHEKPKRVKNKQGPFLIVCDAIVL